ncbi:hypothetical protein A2661_00770 [Candidatus Giovannonibacteria bacterium RIFCSPHIGHO2_01_FULL_45_24]|uniref:Uncharacterized protein n=1 Tax=Candidatus Giovannonibacteria bacterium RIFCSPLOWO2_01_FULL_46_32 TaxID=1798353 RepID=A0A1F5XGW7_9BACT|nr:MAG: hypothetical protein A2661_00770 [Candidatus Giovannonibacteria bacterium RIFCSPHIGHO2_01_FULL_45_24]OGF87109.1 MAG: hypothetical protein A3B19_01610 [Candidatus Giovannonibacteria bacterium RIFCSPLOWO2_01_FULL_46_32]
MNDNQLITRVEKAEKDIADLKKAVFGNNRPKPKIKGSSHQEPDFSLNIRAFVKRYAAGKSGPKRFVLLLAFLTKSEVGVDVELEKVRNEWSKMSAKNLLGKFNRFYPNEAKTQGWADSKAHGTYCLTNAWKEVYE